MIVDPSEQAMYCPVCGRVVFAVNALEVEMGADDGLIFLHDDVPHADDEIEALEYGIN